MKRGEEWALNPADRGPVRKLARDFIDSGRHPSEYYLYVFLVVFAVNLAGRNRLIEAVVYLVLLALIALMALDVFFIRRGLRKLIAERLPGTSSYQRGLTWYAFRRAASPRRFRMPKPTVKLGEKF